MFKALKHAVTDQAIKEAGIERISYKIRIENNLPCPERSSLHFLDRFENLDMKQVIKLINKCLTFDFGKFVQLIWLFELNKF